VRFSTGICLKRRESALLLASCGAVMAILVRGKAAN
jgi:hypothetical protein